MAGKAPKIGLALTGLLASLAALHCGGEREGREPLTFTRDVAPILFANCAACHRPGEAAPFSLLTYAEAQKRARQIAATTRTRFMPPWLPEPDVAFAGQRGLTDDEIERIGRWVADGARQGDPADLPPAPAFPEGWQLGEPDLVVELDEAYTLPAGGPDVIRNFVVPSPVASRQWIRAVELRPGNKRVVHHAILKKDGTRRSRQLDRADPEAGFSGMEMGNAEHPDGQIIVWTPGSVAHAGTEGIAWSLDGDSDLVLQLHLVPGGKPEELRPRIGLYFTRSPPTREPFTVLLRNDAIDIPPGVADYEVESAFVLPVPVLALGIYPHAHYLCKRMEIAAELPDGSRRWLLRILDWNFDWQGMYHYAEPLALPAGSRLHMRYTFDNSEDNPRNPSQPPRRVQVGNRSSDEMATLALQVLPQSHGDLEVLQIAQWEELVRSAPANPAGYYNLGVIHAGRGELERAAGYYERALDLDPEDAATQFYLAGVYYKLGQPDRALAGYEEAVRQDPQFAGARFVLGLLLASRGELQEAKDQLERVLALDPGFAEAERQLGLLRERQGRKDEPR